MINSKMFPDAWKIYIDCVRKWEESDLKEYPEGWKYGIPNPNNHSEYLYSNCPGKLFITFKDLFYKRDEIMEFRKFLWKLEQLEGKVSPEECQSNIDIINTI